MLLCLSHGLDLAGKLAHCLKVSNLHSFEISSPDYLWVDPHTRKGSKVPARTYIDYAMTWIDNNINDESVFPTKAGKIV